jgi:hypothetical protein
VSRFDPDGNFVWGDSLEGVQVNDIVADDHGLYITGDFAGRVNFSQVYAADVRLSTGRTDAFLSRYDADGNEEWTITWGGEIDSDDTCKAVAVDSAGDVYVQGIGGPGIDLDPGTDVHTVETEGDTDKAFLLKLDSSHAFQWATTWAIWETDPFPVRMVLDNSENIWITGILPKERARYSSADFSRDPDTDRTQGLVMGFNPEGGIIASWPPDKSGDDYFLAKDIAVDGEGNIFLIGNFNGCRVFGPEVGYIGCGPLAIQSFLMKIPASELK